VTPAVLREGAREEARQRRRRGKQGKENETGEAAGLRNWKLWGYKERISPGSFRLTPLD